MTNIQNSQTCDISDLDLVLAGEPLMHHETVEVACQVGCLYIIIIPICVDVVTDGRRVATTWWLRMVGLIESNGGDKVCGFRI